MAAPRKPTIFTGNSPLAPLMAQLIQEKRACGYRYDVGVWSLRRLDAHLCRRTRGLDRRFVGRLGACLDQLAGFREVTRRGIGGNGAELPEILAAVAAFG